MNGLSKSASQGCLLRKSLNRSYAALSNSFHQWLAKPPQQSIVAFSSSATLSATSGDRRAHLPVYPATSSADGSLSSAASGGIRNDALVHRLMTAKEAAGLSFSDIGRELGLCNAYVAQLFFNQSQLKPETAEKLHKLLPQISAEDLEVMRRAPLRSYPPSIDKDPTVYRLQEAVLHYGEGIKAIVNEEFGDGIMSAIDVFVTVKKVKGKHGEDRVVITLNGKFLPHIEQREEDRTD